MARNVMRLELVYEAHVFAALEVVFKLFRLVSAYEMPQAEVADFVRKRAKQPKAPFEPL